MSGRWIYYQHLHLRSNTQGRRRLIFPSSKFGPDTSSLHTSVHLEAVKLTIMPRSHVHVSVFSSLLQAQDRVKTIGVVISNGVPLELSEAFRATTFPWMHIYIIGRNWTHFKITIRSEVEVKYKVQKCPLR